MSSSSSAGGPAAGFPREVRRVGEGGIPDAAQKRLPPSCLARSSGHNSAAPCAQPAPEPLQRPSPGRRPIGRTGCTPKLAFLTTGRLGPRLQDPEARTQQWEKQRQPVKPSQGSSSSSSSSCYSLTNMAAADAAAACPGRAPSRSHGSTSWPSRSHSSIFSNKQSLLRGGQPAPHPPAGYLRGSRGRGVHDRPAGHGPRREEVRGGRAG